jgi:SAM-dependent methyltransferase
VRRSGSRRVCDSTCSSLSAPPAGSWHSATDLSRCLPDSADPADFNLGLTFDAVVCLFSAIGYVVTVKRLHSALAAMARHLRPGGVLLVEPWLPLTAIYDWYRPRTLRGPASAQDRPDQCCRR